MTQEICKQISDLLGTVALSELPEDHSGLFSGEYVVYKPQGSNPPKVYRIPADSFAGYLAKHAFMFLMEWPNGQGTPSEDPQRSTVYLNPMGHVGVDDTPVQFARRLLEWRMPGKDSDTIEEKSGSSWTNNVWVGGSKGKNISTKWFKHFQYYYFDDLSNRQRTMLLKYGPGETSHKQYDIFIWLDASTSMVPEIQNLSQSISDLCGLIFAQNPNNRVSIVQFHNSGYDENSLSGATSKREWRHLGFTNDLDEVETFMTALSSHHSMKKPNSTDTVFHWNDENMWFLKNLVDSDYTYKARETSEDTNWDSNYSDWDSAWSAVDKRTEWSTNPDVQKLCVIISDESADTYVSVTGQVRVPYKQAWWKPETFHKTSFTAYPKDDKNNNYLTDAWLSANGFIKDSTDGIYHDLDVVDSADDPETQKIIFENASWGPFIVGLGHDTCKTMIDGVWNGQYHPTNRTSAGTIIWNTVNCKVDSNWNLSDSTSAVLKPITPWQWDLGGYDGNLNKKNPSPWTNVLEKYGYVQPDPNNPENSKYSLDKWISAFKSRGIKVFYLETNDDKDLWIIRGKDEETGAINGESRSFNGQFVSCGMKWIKAYNYLIQRDLLNPLDNGSQLYSIQPTEVASTLAEIFKNEAIIGDDSFWSNSMWYSHLKSPKTVQTLPVIVNRDGQLKKLYLPPTAVVPNPDPDRSVTDPDNFIWSEFKKRNYVKIVTGGWEKDNLHDTRWADPDEGLNDENLGPEVNEDLVVDGVTLQKNMGDIDQTFTTLEQFLDEAIESLVPAEHPGQIIFTASKVNNPLSLNWKNVIPDNATDGSFVWAGTSSITGENTIKISNVPKHHHNTTFENGNAISISNVSVVGRPEGETVGGIAKTDSAERLPDGSFGRIEDRIQTGLVATSAITNMKGAYCGTVTYSSYKVDADQVPHNNMPLYYKMRAFYHD